MKDIFKQFIKSAVKTTDLFIQLVGATAMLLWDTTVKVCKYTHKKMDEAAVWFYHHTVYNRLAGSIYFGCEDMPADGTLVIRAHTSDRLSRSPFAGQSVNFYIPNRYLIKGGKVPAPRVLQQVQSQALEMGWAVAYIKWGDQIVSPYGQLEEMASVEIRRVEDGVTLAAASTPVSKMRRSKIDNRGLVAA